MQLRYPKASWRPLGVQREPSIGVPRVFVIHTMAGYLRSTESLFAKNGYVGVESTFGLGGPWDGADLDGTLWQWQSLDHQADAEAAGNAYATSLETSDGGDPDRPWSARQLEAIVSLGVWWCQQTGRPARIIPNLSSTQLAIGGFGYHRQFAVWNPNRHSCPGDVRLKQYVDYVVPEIARRLAGQDGQTDMRLESDMQLVNVPGVGIFAASGAHYTRIMDRGGVKASVILEQLSRMSGQDPKNLPRLSAVALQTLDVMRSGQPERITVDVAALAAEIVRELIAKAQPGGLSQNQVQAAVEAGVRVVLHGA